MLISKTMKPNSLAKNKFFSCERPLAWAQLTHQRARLVVALIGVSFANILMFSQLGLRAVLFDGVTLLHENLEGDLFLVSSFSSNLLKSVSFPQAHLYRASAVPGVLKVSPLYIEESTWVNPEELEKTESLKPINPGKDEVQENNLDAEEVMILAFNPTQPAFNLPTLNKELNKLSRPDSILFDQLSQPSLGDIPALISKRGEVSTIMGNKRTYVVGLYELGSTMFTDGFVIMSDWNYKRHSKDNKQLENVSLGLLILEPGVNSQRVQMQLRKDLPPTLEVLNREELIEKEMKFWDADPSGIVLNFGAVIGFIVGVIVVYQVLYTDVSEHLPEYATLKAMGYSDFALLSIVLQEALILAVLGFIPGSLSSIGVYQLLSALTRIPLTLRPDVAFQVFLLTILMCSLSGIVAIRRLRTADPADIF
jgi:putative ABC transport system permease protein